MLHWIKKISATISNKGGIFTFLRAQLSSQLASYVDFLVSFLIAYLFNIFYGFATFIGQICGGITNCVVNYRWTFKAKNVKKRYVAIRYLPVWSVSLFLNTTGTVLLTELLYKIPWLKEASGFFYDNIFMLSKAIVSLLVGYLWNYNMHRFFVYKNLNFKQAILKLKKQFQTNNSLDNSK